MATMTWGARVRTFGLATAAMLMLACGGGSYSGSYAPKASMAYAEEATEYADGDYVEEESLEDMSHAPGVYAKRDMDDAGAPHAGLLAAPPAKMAKKSSEGGESAKDQASDGAATAATSSTNAAGTASPPNTTKRRPMLIYEASLGMAVFRVQENLDTIQEMATERGGYLVSRGTTSVQIRVPVEHFETTLDAIIALGDVHQRQVTARDVTAEYTDLQIRMKNALAMRERLEALLKKAENVEEALEVEKQLHRVTEIIERMKGRLKLLRELSAFSTITVEFRERQTTVTDRVDLPFPWLYDLGLHNLLDL